MQEAFEKLGDQGIKIIKKTVTDAICTGEVSHHNFSVKGA